jgi:hypothetical protein
MTPFDLINTDRYKNSPFSVPCPYCGSASTYLKERTKFFQTHASYVSIEVAGSGDPEELRGAAFGQCGCNNRECQEITHFIGSYFTKLEDSQRGSVYEIVFLLKFFYPAIPLIPIPPKTPQDVKSLLGRSFAPAFMDQSASGNLLRSAIEAILTECRVPRFVTAKNRRHRLSLHERIGLLPQNLQSYKDNLLAVKWIGNAASHDNLSVNSLRLAFEIVQNLLEELYGTRKREMLRAIKRINRRKRP